MYRTKISIEIDDLPEDEVAGMEEVLVKWHSAQTAGSAPGPWRLANSPALQFALPNAYFDSLGIPRTPILSTSSVYSQVLTWRTL